MADELPTISDTGPPAPTPVIPDHELLRCIGRGSFGEVWLAKSVTGQFRAVKVIYRISFETSRPFDREFSGIQRYEPISRSHPGLVTILHVGINKKDGYFYYIMELADDQFHGQRIDAAQYVPKTLFTELHHRKRLPFEECLQVGLSLTLALEHLHEQGLAHRDIKPSNIIFVNGAPKLADIGLVANLETARTFVGTEGYIPPEGPGTKHADVYSLGKVLYEISTGKDRLDFPDFPTDLADMSERERLLELNEVILKACKTDVAKRYRTARQVHADLALLTSADPRKHRTSIRPRTASIVKRVFVASVIAGAIFLTLAGGKYAFRAWEKFREREKASQTAVHSTLFLFTPAVDPSTGEVTINGGESRPATIVWDWGDGKTDTGPFMRPHFYKDVKRKYVVTVTSHYAEGGTAQAQVEVDFLNPPVSPASTLTLFSPSVDASTGKVTINGVDATSRQGGTSIWDWGDGQTEADRIFPASHTYADVTRNYVVTVISRYAKGGSSWAQVTVIFPTPPPPTASLATVEPAPSEAQQTVAQAGNAASDSPVFFDNFVDAMKWSPVGGLWTVVDGKYQQSSPDGVFWSWAEIRAGPIMRCKRGSAFWEGGARHPSGSGIYIGRHLLFLSGWGESSPDFGENHQRG